MIQKEILEKYINKGFNYSEIANELSVSKNTVMRYSKKYGMKTLTGSQGARTHKFNELYFENIDSEEKAYWLGFISADGCVYENSGSSRLQINLKGQDSCHLELFQQSIKSDYKISVKNIKTSTVAQLKINSKVMCDSLSRYGIVPRKSLIVKMPKLDNSLYRHFIRGYFDGDGCITESERGNRYTQKVCIVGGSEMLNSIKDITGINFGLYKLKRESEIYSLECSSSEAVTDFYIYLYTNATVFLNRKYEKFNFIMSRLAEMQGQ